MNQLSYILDYEEMRIFREASCRSVKKCKEAIKALQVQLAIMQESDAFQGKAADGIKNYFQEVHGTLLDAIWLMLDDYEKKIHLYIDIFMNEVDPATDTRIPQAAIEEMKGHIRFTALDFGDIIDDINADLRSIGHIMDIFTYHQLYQLLKMRNSKLHCKRRNPGIVLCVPKECTAV